MKAGFSSSLVLHAALLGFGLFTLSAPPAHDTGDVNRLTGRMEGFADEFSAILSRQIDEKLQPRAAAE